MAYCITFGQLGANSNIRSGSWGPQLAEAMLVPGDKSWDTLSYSGKEKREESYACEETA